MSSFQKEYVTLKIPRVWHTNLLGHFLMSKYLVKKVIFLAKATICSNFLKKGGVDLPPTIIIGECKLGECLRYL